MRAEPLTQMSELWNRLFSSVETQGPTTADYYGSDSLQLGGAIKLGEQTVFLVSAPADGAITGVRACLTYMTWGAGRLR